MTPTKDFLFCIIIIAVGCLGALALAYSAPAGLREPVLVIVVFWIIVFVVVPLTFLYLKEKKKRK
jgi:hypothetical protein